MFCFQCEQTAKGSGCTVQGVCGKKADVAQLHDRLTSMLIELATVSEGREQLRDRKFGEFLLESLFITVTNVNFDAKDIEKYISKAEEYMALFGASKELLDMEQFWQDNEDRRSLRTLVLLGLRGLAAYGVHAFVLGYYDPEIINFVCKALASLKKELSLEEMIAMVTETGKYCFECMKLLDQANTESFGHPEPASVTTEIEAGPFIVITGHDLEDLRQLLQQSEGKGVNIYTHGEMLPAHAYPELRKYTHLKGNFGTAWQNQQKEFDAIPAPILFTTNCIMIPKASYKDRVYTTSVVGFPETKHIEAHDGKKDFSEIIEHAKKLGGYSEKKKLTGINGGNLLTVGFGRNSVMSVAGKVIDAVKSGALKHIFLVGGCDGAKPGRNYYTKFVESTPADSLVLTLACGKYRFNDLNLGDIGGIPRILDMGQCNDAYSAIYVAIELAKAFNCTVNDLPLSLIISWYEQKAVCVLLALLYLGIKNIRLGPSLPAFVSPTVLNFLIENFNISLITTPEEDLKAILGN